MDMFKMIKEAAAMKSRLADMEKSLRAQVIEVENRGVTVRMNGKSEMLDIKLSPELLKQDVSSIEKNVLSAVQQALKKSQDAMEQEARKITGGMKIPGLM